MDRPNIMLIVVDALRADFVDIRGKATPNLKRFSQDCIYFENCISQGISTAPSMTSMLTSTYPLEQRGHWYLIDTRYTIAEVLKKAGYQTAAIHSNPNISRLRNFNKGFDMFEENLTPWYLRWLIDKLPAKGVNYLNKLFRIISREPYLNAPKLNKKITSWIQNNPNKPFFIWTQYMDVHGPYLSRKGFSYFDKIRAEKLWHKAAVTHPERITKKERLELIKNYRAEVNLTDRAIGQLMLWLKKKNLYDSSLIIVTSDHGDEFGEHGKYGHVNNPYEELIRVPLFIKFPLLRKGRIIKNTVRLIDIMPTILELAGIKLEYNLKKIIKGHSLVPLIENKSTAPYFDHIIIEKEARNTEKLQIAIRTDEWKYIFDGTTNKKELFNIKNDMNEKHNLINKETKIKKNFEDILEKHLEYIARSSNNIKIPYVKESKEVEDRLRALGYLD